MIVAVRADIIILFQSFFVKRAHALAALEPQTFRNITLSGSRVDFYSRIF
jgi:hypothetical protein